MRPSEDIKRLIQNTKIKINQDVKKTALKQLINELEQTKNIKRAKFMPDIGRIIMNSTILKLASAAVIIIVILIGISQLSDGSAAFADVIGYIQKNSYTFDLSGLTPQPIRAMVWELGRIRIDFPSAVDVGDMSSITDFNTGQTLLLFHRDKTAAMKNEPAFKNLTEETISLCTRPIAELWNVLDGMQEYMGEKEINGQRVSGFRIIKEGQDFEYDITIWADFKSGLPFMVETMLRPIDNSFPSITTTIENFKLNVKLDENLFSLDLPPEYTLAYQEDLKNMEVGTELSPEAEKIIQILDLGLEGRQDEAIEILMQIDWTKPIEFGKEPYIFSVSEKGYKALKAEDQKIVDEDISIHLETIREITLEVLELGQKAVSDKQYQEAQKCFNTVLQFGKLIEENQNSILVVRLVGVSIEKRALNELIPLYAEINENEKLQEAQNQLNRVEAEVQKIREEAEQMNQ